MEVPTQLSIFDKLLIKLGAYYITTGSEKYTPFEIEVEDFDKLKDMLDYKYIYLLILVIICL